MRLTSLVIFLVTLVLTAACSSSSSSGNAPVSCDVSNISPSNTSNICVCDVPSSDHVANDAICNDARFGANALCVYSPQVNPHDNPSQCACFDFACDKRNTGDDVECGYELGLFDNEYTRVPSSECTGAHYCMSPGACDCQSAACDPSFGQKEVSSCTDADAIKALQANQTASNDSIVSDCRVALGGSSGGGGGSATNVCPGGPGKCANGDSSTCKCGEACVATSTAVGSPYECVKGCATDSDCTGYFSGDSPPAQLTCIGASSTMPTPHCGL